MEGKVYVGSGFDGEPIYLDPNIKKDVSDVFADFKPRTEPLPTRHRPGSGKVRKKRKKTFGKRK